MSRGIEIVIDELRLRGVPHADADALRAALERRLAELGAGWAQAGAAPVARDQSFARTPRAHPSSGEPAALGGAVAERVFGTVMEERR